MIYEFGKRVETFLLDDTWYIDGVAPSVHSGRSVV
jgi:hypothetical protein